MTITKQRKLLALVAMGVAICVSSSTVSRAEVVQPSQLNREQLNSSAYLTITEMETVELTKKVVKKKINPSIGEIPMERLEDKEPPTLPKIGGIDITQMVTLGMEVWKLIEANKPVVEVDFKPSVSVVPAGITDWAELEGWTAPQVRLFRTTYRNALRMNVVEFTYRLIYTYNGSIDGKGKFLGRVEIEPAKLDVSWGYKVTAAAEAVNPINVGSKSDPMAAMELRVNWSVESTLRNTRTSNRFYVRGDGLFKETTNGSIL